VVDHAYRQDAVLLETIVGREQFPEMPVTIGKMIDRAAPFRNVGILRHLDECDPMVFVIIGHEADDIVAKHNVRTEDGLIPPDNLVDLFCLDDNMREERRLATKAAIPSCASLRRAFI
jgi:hypothetical protein